MTKNYWLGHSNGALPIIAHRWNSTKESILATMQTIWSACRYICGAYTINILKNFITHKLKIWKTLSSYKSSLTSLNKLLYEIYTIKTARITKNFEKTSTLIIITITEHVQHKPIIFKSYLAMIHYAASLNTDRGARQITVTDKNMLTKIWALNVLCNTKMDITKVRENISSIKLSS